jgi:hypothetical protein
VIGATTLTADNGVSGAGDVKYGITLANATNDLVGAVSADGNAITLDDTAALTASLDSSGAASLTSGGALNVSGTVDTTLTTKTTSSNSATTFGVTTVGTKLVVTSSGAVAQAASGDLTVAGAGTATSNPHVTVNGVVGATID